VARLGRWAAGWTGAVALVLLATAACSGGDGGGNRAGERDADESRAERAPEAVVQVVMPGDIDVELDQLSAAVGTETTRVVILGSGEVDEIGRGRAARRPAEGERFIVAEIEQQDVPVGPTVPTPEQAPMLARGAATFTVEVGGRASGQIQFQTPSYTPLPIDLDNPPQVAPPAAPAGAQRRLLVVSAPREADDVDLVVSSAGLVQKVSLLTGEPAAENVALLARANRGMNGAVTPQEVSLTQDEFGLTSDATQPIGVAAATLEWSTGSGPSLRSAAPGRAILQIAMDTSGVNYTLATELRLPDGTTVQPTPLPAEDEILASTLPFVSFDVPADFTEGTLMLGKDYTWEVPTGGTTSVTFAAPVEFALAIPLAA
jgi:hypothetical protein